MKRNNEKSHCAKKHDKQKHGKAMATAKQEARSKMKKTSEEEANENVIGDTLVVCVLG